MSSNLIILTGLIYAYIAVEQALKGNMGLACMYSGYCFANYGAYLIATKWASQSCSMTARKLFNGSLIWTSLLNRCLLTQTTGTTEMTTIIGDWGAKVLVSDSQFTDTVSGIKYFEEKVFPVDGGWLGVAGNYCDAEKVLEYVNKKTKVKPKLKSDSSFLKLTKDGLFSCGDDLEWERVRTFMAIGSGSMAAEVCMRMGLTAEEAVKWACNVDASSSEPIKTYRLTDAV